MEKPIWWRNGIGLAAALAIVTAASGPAVGKSPQDPNATQQSANPLEFNLKNIPIVGDAVVGGGILTRTKSSVHAQVSVTQLTPNVPYTAWWVVFNEPENCDVFLACGPDDLSNAAANVAVFHAAGFFSDASGQANVTADLFSGNLPDDIDGILGIDDGVGLETNNGLGAELHIVIRGHGPVPALNDGSAGYTVAEQLSQFNGGCPAAVGDPLDACEDVQVYIFQKP